MNTRDEHAKKEGYLLDALIDQVGESHKQEQTQKEQYQALCNNILKRTGQKGMVWHCFASEAEAKKFLVWLQQQANLLPLKISKARIQEEKLPEIKDRPFVIRLTDEQLQVIGGWTAEDKALVEVNDQNETGLLVAARTKAENGFMRLVEKALPEALNAALVKQANDGWTGLHTAARYQSESAFKALVEKVSPEALNAALVEQDYDNKNGGWTALHTAAWYQSESAFKALVEKASPEALNAALVMQNKNGWTALQMAACYQSESVFITLLQKVSPEALVQAVSRQSAAMWAGVFTYQSPVAIALCLTKLIPSAPEVLADLPQMVIRNMATYLLHEDRWRHNPLLIEYCFKSWGKDLAPYLINAWLEGCTFTPKVATGLQRYLSQPDKILTNKEKDWLTYQAKKAIDKGKITLADGSSLALDLLPSPALIVELFKKGLAGWQDVRILRERQATMPQLKEALDKLVQLRLVGRGSMVNTSSTTAVGSPSHLACQALMAQVQQDNVLLKVIKPEAWQEFIDQMKDYNTRPSLRKKVDKTKATHKFKHLEGKVVDYHHDASSSANKAHASTKKTSTTWLAKNLSTMVFGEHDDSRELVGMLFYRDRCHLKGLLAQDSGTYHREWVDKKAAVEDYVRKIQAINYTDTNQFIERVNANPHRTNEALACLTRESMAAIVIARDTLNAREIARARQKEIANLFQATLPIVFFDKITKTFQPYTTETMQADEGMDNNYNEMAAKNVLLNLQYKIKQKTDWQVFSLFSCFRPTLLPKTATLILEKIKQAEQEANAGNGVWVKAEAEVKTLLEKVTTETSIFRYKDTEVFYKQAYGMMM